MDGYYGDYYEFPDVKHKSNTALYIFLFVLFLLLLGGGIGAYWYYYIRKDDDTK